MSHSDFDRRSVLRSGAALLGASAIGSLGIVAPAWPRDRKTRRVILVAFAGGVRSRETFGTPGNVPNLMRMASEGVAYHRARTRNLGHFGASLSIFTGIAEARGIRENARGEDPTIFEYVRKDVSLAAGDVWISTSGGAQQTNYSHSLHPDYGPDFGANALDGDGIFNAEFKNIIAAYGRPRKMEASERELLQRLRGAVGDRPGGGDEAAALAKVEKYILDELQSGTVNVRGTGSADAKALIVARNLMAVFRPKLLGVVLSQADVAHGSYNAYVEVIRRNDEKLGELWDAVREDPELAETTSFIILPEFGRDADLNARRGLDHGDGSDDLNYVSIVCWGPDFRRGEVIQKEVRTIDVCPTVADLMGARARFSRGKRLPGLFS